MKFFRELFETPIQLVWTVARIMGNGSLFLYCVIPYVLGAVGFISLLILSYSNREAISTYLFNVHSGFALAAASWSIFVFSIFASSLLALLIVVALAGFFVEEFVDKLLVLEGLKVETKISLSFILKSTLRGLVDAARRFCYLAILGIVLLAFGFFPLLYIPSLILGFFVVGGDLVNLPLSLMGIKFGARFKLMRNHFGSCVILGVLFSLALLIPFGGIIFLPLAYGVAVLKIVNWKVQSIP